MAKVTGPSSSELKRLIIDLRKLSTKEGVNLWKRIANDLSRPRRIRREVNIGSIDKHIRDGEIAIVPGKVLSEGDMNNKTTVAAYRFSEEAKNKINKNGKAIHIRELMKDNPKGKKVRIIG